MRLDRALFAGRQFSKATILAPPPKFDPANPGASTPIPLAIERSPNGLTFTLPELDLWGIVKLEGE